MLDRTALISKGVGIPIVQIRHVTLRRTQTNVQMRVTVGEMLEQQQGENRATLVQGVDGAVKTKKGRKKIIWSSTY